MNKLYILLLLIPLTFAGCVNNNDDPLPGPESPEGEVVKTLTIENLIGTWQQYYYTKAVNNGTPFRYIEFDGNTITFNANSTFSMSDIRGVVGRTGAFNISRSDSIVFTSEPDSITANMVPFISNFRFTTIDAYVGVLTGAPYLYNIVDTKLWRNIATMPTGHPGLTKEEVTVERLQGQWVIYSFRAYINSQIAGDNSEREAQSLGISFLFNSDKTYIEYAQNGNIATQGTYVIVDDVVHMFNKAIGGEQETYSVWITDWVNDEFMFYSKTMDPIPGGSGLNILEDFTGLRRKVP